PRPRQLWTEGGECREGIPSPAAPGEADDAKVAGNAAPARLQFALEPKRDDIRRGDDRSGGDRSRQQFACSTVPPLDIETAVEEQRVGHQRGECLSAFAGGRRGNPCADEDDGFTVRSHLTQMPDDELDPLTVVAPDVRHGGGRDPTVELHGGDARAGGVERGPAGGLVARNDDERMDLSPQEGRHDAALQLDVVAGAADEQIEAGMPEHLSEVLGEGCEEGVREVRQNQPDDVETLLP